MNNLTAADYDDFVIRPVTKDGDFHDYVEYSVVGVYTDYYGTTTEDVLVDSLNSTQFAEGWIRVYIDNCVRDRYL